MTSDTNLTRRRYLQGAGAAGAALTMAGCLGGGGGGGSEEVELLHGWSGGDGQAAFDALLAGFEEEYPDVDVNANAIGGSGNTTLDARINTRLGNNNPPSSWAEWPGQNLTQFTSEDLLGDIEEDVWSQNNMKEAYLEGPQEAAQVGGSYVCVPTNIHRLNNVFYNVSVLEDAGIDAGSLETPADLVEAAATVEEETDAIGFAHAMSNPWTTLQLWACVFLGEHGTEAYDAFINGEGDVDKVQSSLETVAELSEYFNSDAGTVGFQEANQYVIDGEAAFFDNGDWAAQMYISQEDFEYGTDWDHIAFPGTEDYYSLNMDSWVFPADGPNPEDTKKWLTYCGTKDAQVRFNTNKGSIPPRSDVSTEEFGPFQTDQIGDFQDSEAQPPSIAHGLATTPEVLNNLKQATQSNFSTPSQSAAEETAQAYIDAF
ncbi:ABC-type transport system periplasmic substrate-binding protein (probable substrate sugar) [Halobacterium hubeiense]|uniref:ABC-type transport system periplasmic substrate-binding protein (Probable substrate sugar) n=1 Tax=Halobacterium hubeiense TaxID=1407499 RepID=A0A0U5H332_9EURY|nr:ABC transporter substrate-binding protein [Halobacterium hubeiense]CQH56177.1 ABC-type transport system periplasmic substrate-binding protein (probable substrate sugar) [Halobacterium hubeiense]